MSTDCQTRISGYDFWKRCVFKRRRKIGSDGAVATSSGNSFHIRDPETRNVRPLTAERLKVKTTKQLVLADRDQWEDQVQDTELPCHAEFCMLAARFYTERAQALVVSELSDINIYKNRK